MKPASECPRCRGVGPHQLDDILCDTCVAAIRGPVGELVEVCVSLRTVVMAALEDKQLRPRDAVRTAEHWVARADAVIQKASTGASPNTIHVVHHGQALCGQGGVPSSWPEGMNWVRLEDAGVATCDWCIAALQKKANR